MNRIYRRIWNATRHCWVVASELSSPRGKASRVRSGSFNGRFMLAALLLCPSLAAHAGTAADCALEDEECLNDSSSNWINIDPELRAFSPLPLSKGASLLATTNTAYGTDAYAASDAGSAFGSSASGYANAVAMGYRAKAYGFGSLALGYESRAENNSAYAIAIGHSASAGSNGYAGAIAIGYISGASYNGVALGIGARATGYNSVALGADSRAEGSNVVSIGSAGNERYLTNVKNGRIQAGSTDAVNGGQLNSVAGDVSNALSTANAAKSNADSALSKANTLSTLLSQTASNGSVRIGAGNSGSLLDIRNSGGYSRKITGVAEGTIGSNSTDAVNGTQLNRVQNSATDARTVANSAQTAANTAQTTASAAKTNADSALGKANTLSTLLSQTASNGNVRIGAGNSGTLLDVSNNGGNARRISGVADGGVGTSSTDAVNGAQLNKVQISANEAKTLAGTAQTTANTAKTNADNALSRVTALGGLLSQTTDSVRIGASNAGTVLDVRNSSDVARKITGVANGTIGTDSTDAVNGAQLNATHAVATSARTTANAAAAQAQATSYMLTNGTPGNHTNKAQATGTGALANGVHTEASGTAATAVGRIAKALADGAIAIGDRAKIDAAAHKNSIAVGTLATASAASAVALGDNSKANHLGSVALGSGSVTNAAGQVSVGNSATKTMRKIVNVADGMLSSTSNEAVTGAQLFVTDKTARDAGIAAKGAVATAEGAASQAKALEGLIQQTAPAGVVRLGAENEGAILNVSNKSGKQRTITGIAAGALSQQSSEAVTGSQLYGTNLRVGSLEGLVREDAPAGNVRLGGNNSGSVLDVRNKSDGKRKISGVADGALAAGSTDAVTGGQLAATNASVAGAEKLISDVATRVEAASRHIAVGAPVDDEKAQAGRLGIAIGDSAFAAPTMDGAVALGSYSRALGENSVALGRAAWVQDGADGGFALGTGSVVGEQGGLALGADSSVKKGARNAVAIGDASTALESNTASFGDGALQRRLTNLARGTADHNATTVGQLNDALATLGGGAKLDAAGNVTAPTYTVQNTRQHTVGDALAILDGAVLRTSADVDRVEGQLRSVFQDTPSTRADGLNQLTFAGANGMILSNVGNGLIAAGSRDAVNGGQLHSMQQQLNGRMDGLEQRIDGQPQSRMMALASNESGTPANPPVAEEPAPSASNDDKVVANTGNAPKSSPPPKAEAPESPKPQVDTAELEKMLARANDYSDGIAREVDARLNKMDKRFNRMAAMSSAQTAMAMNTAGLATYNRLGAGVGYAEGESAMAVGYQRVLNDKGSATFSLNGAFTNSGERSMGVGVGIGW